MDKVKAGDLNTSHVTVNLQMRKCSLILNTHLNTSHVTVNLEQELLNLNSIVRFKYISCYC